MNIATISDINEGTLHYLEQTMVVDDFNVLKDKAEMLELKMSKIEKKIKKHRWVYGNRR